MRNLLAVLIFFVSLSMYSQTTLNTGDIAFIGWFSDGVDGNGFNDGFTFILLRDLSEGTIIYFTDNGWSDAGWVNSASEVHVSWTVPSGGLTAGTIVYIYETSAYNNGTASVGTLSTLLYGTTWHYASSGDQILAYQGSSARTSSPAFVAAIHADYNTSLDGTNGWSTGTVTGGFEETHCTLPTGLTNGTNCVALFNSSQGELWDNCKYNGTLTGTAATILSLINDYTNWTGSNDTPYDISAPAFPTPDVSEPFPVELTSFTAIAKGKAVELAWQTATEVNNHGFEVQRSEVSSQMSERNWTKVGFVAGNGNSNSPKSYNFVDASAKGKVVYRLKQIDNDGAFEYHGMVEVNASGAITKHALMQNYPNPFNPATQISYQLPASGFVSLKVYDMLGKEIATLVNGMQEAGEQHATFTASKYPSGMYFYTLRIRQTEGGQDGSYVETKKMLLVK